MLSHSLGMKAKRNKVMSGLQTTGKERKGGSYWKSTDVCLHLVGSITLSPTYFPAAAGSRFQQKHSNKQTADSRQTQLVNIVEHLVA